MKVSDRKTGQQKLDTGFMNTESYSQPGNAVIPVALRLPLDKLEPGSYTSEFKAIDAAGNASVTRTVDFDVLP